MSDQIQAYPLQRCIPCDRWDRVPDNVAAIAAATGTIVRDLYRDLAAASHPDRGGTDEQMARLNVARDRALADLAGM